MNPKIICHIMSSVDGRLLTERWTEPFNGKSKGELMGVYAAIGRKLNADAWMFGKNTLQEGYFPKKFHTSDKTPLAHPIPYLAHKTSSRLFVVIDPDADILYESSAVRGDRIVTVLPETAPAAYLEYLQQRDISYLFAGVKGDELNAAMKALAETFGVETLSLQGGGIIDGAFLQAGLIDELSLVVYPGIDGSASSPSIFEYIGREQAPARGLSLELLSAETVQDGVVWLRYKFHK
ncbi:dihydrofolate reductase family protein [Bacteroides gallinaceum]|uniref:dihydrofolate reductase family protein n=1 Tax=Bacteroides gallinaceum TaxID=1462571 RepID=UPI0025A41C41|nr:dihydrofolate reductase family protein [Bacteroides gallinaceum]MDM8153755.1 dihydrofolate reductase family protein [Bacteroides gallinaceum]